MKSFKNSTIKVLTVKLLTVCAMFGFFSFFNPNVNAWVPPGGGTPTDPGGGGWPGATTLVCTGTDQRVCAITAGGDTLMGYATVSIKNSLSSLDNDEFGKLVPANISNTTQFLNKMTIFICTDTSTVQDIKIGFGYIDVASYFNNGYTTYLPNTGVVYTNYDEWKAALEFIEKAQNYTGGKALVYPNPASASDIAFVKFEEHYIEVSKVQSIKYELYNSNQELLATLESNDPTSTVQLPSNFIARSGTYFVKCHVFCENEKLNEVIDLHFVVAK